jgi:hypothetical protein
MGLPVRRFAGYTTFPDWTNISIARKLSSSGVASSKRCRK